MSSPLAQIRALLAQKQSTVTKVIKGSGVSATVHGAARHANAMPGDTLLAHEGRVIRLTKAPAAIQK